MDRLMDLIGIRLLPERWAKVVANDGQYFETEWLDTVSDGSSPFPPVGHIGGMFVGHILLFCGDFSPGNRV
nr:hypothetical protein HmN_000360100 [Hymenolepis microstoma]